MAKSDYIVYTASDPDAIFLQDYLEDKNFTVPSDDLGEAAMVIVVDADGARLKKVLKASGVDHRFWKVSKVGPGVKLGGMIALGAERPKKEKVPIPGVIKESAQDFTEDFFGAMGLGPRKDTIWGRWNKEVLRR